MGTVTATVSDFYLSSVWSVSGGNYTMYPGTAKATKTFSVAGIPSGNKVTAASLSVAIGSPLTGAAILTVGGTNATAGATHTQSIDVTGNGDYPIEVVFRANGSTSSDGQHSAAVTFANCVLTVTYETDVDPVPPPDPVTIEESEKLVVLFDGAATDFSGNGICVLSPLSYSITEEAGGEYELELEHPMDGYGKWQMLDNDRIIRAPVPKLVIPAITLPAASVWKVKTSVTTTPLYSVLPTYTAASSPIDKIKSDPTSYEWTENPYPVDSWVTYQGGIYVSLDANQNKRPDAYPQHWQYRADVTGGGGSASGGAYDPGKTIEVLSGGELITKIADYNAYYMQVRSLRGTLGYVWRGDCEETQQQAEGTVIPSRTIRTQLFRIYSIECEDDTHTVTVRARHKSYDYQGNALFDCQLNEAAPATAIAILQGSLMLADSRLIACNITGQKITADWSFQNPIMALLDPDEGLLGQSKGKLIRDNDDFFILDNSVPRKGPDITYGINMRGVQWTRNTEEVITRIIPRAGDGNGGYVYLDELFVDSPHINDYPVIRIEVLDTEWEVGQEIELPDGTKQTLTREDCLAKMRQDAEKRFSDDMVDAELITLDVQFLLLGDTEQYKQYRDLQTVNLYDQININAGPSGVTIAGMVTGYTWVWNGDRCMFKDITIENVQSIVRNAIPGYRVNKHAITYSKLAPGLVRKIRGQQNGGT